MGSGNMKHIIYKITNTLNGKFYIGAHSTKDVNDSYFGSGVALNRAIKKHGKENFIKEILYYCDSKESLYELEREIVNEEFINRPDTYNMKLGGAHNNGYRFTDDQKRLISEKTKDAMSSVKHKISGENHYMYGKNHSDADRKRRSDAMKMAHKTGRYSRDWKHTEQSKARLSKSLKGVYVGEKSASSRPIYANGHRYVNIAQASMMLNITPAGIRYRIKSLKWPDWRYENDEFNIPEKRMGPEGPIL